MKRKPGAEIGRGKLERKAETETGNGRQQLPMYEETKVWMARERCLYLLQSQCYCLLSGDLH